MVDLGDAEPIDAMVRAFRRSVDPEGRDKTIPRHFAGSLGPFKITFDWDIDREHHDREISSSMESWQLADRLRVALVDKVVPRDPEEPGNASAAQIRRLVIATDGELNLLPFEALPTRQGKYLIDEYEISYLGTARDMMRNETGSDVELGDAVVVADPAFTLAETGGTQVGTHAAFRGEMEREGITFPPLPGTRLEGERISRWLRVKPRMADEVLEGKLKELRSPRVLHTATHGYFLSDQDTLAADIRFFMGAGSDSAGRLSGAGLTNPMLRSGLALAGSQNWLERKPTPGEAEDGLLTAEDVAAMDLRGTEMVVLSACDTGLGEVRHGEGVFGLRRGFLLAGVKTLVMSLWKVDDLAAVLLMDRFYQNLLERGMGRREALREAQRYLRREVTVGGIRSEWLNEDVIAKLAGGDASARAEVLRNRIRQTGDADGKLAAKLVTAEAEETKWNNIVAQTTAALDKEKTKLSETTAAAEKEGKAIAAQGPLYERATTALQKYTHASEAVEANLKRREQPQKSLIASVAIGAGIYELVNKSAEEEAARFPLKVQMKLLGVQPEEIDKAISSADAYSRSHLANRQGILTAQSSLLQKGFAPDVAQQMAGPISDLARITGMEFKAAADTVGVAYDTFAKRMTGTTADKITKIGDTIGMLHFRGVDLDEEGFRRAASAADRFHIPLQSLAADFGPVESSRL